MKADQKGVRIMRILFSIRSLFMTLVMLTLSAASFAQIGVAVSINFAPPELPVYEQPLCPGEGYFWTPGYWAWGGSSFIFYEGYWGPVVGFYGGINYGYGYFGRGYEGGRWDNGRFYYNRSVNNVNITEIHNGCNGGIDVRATPQEEAAARQKHISPVPAQMQHVQAARANQALRASENH